MVCGKRNSEGHGLKKLVTVYFTIIYLIVFLENNHIIIIIMVLLTIVSLF